MLNYWTKCSHNGETVWKGDEWHTPDFQRCMPQTTILEHRTNLRQRLFKLLFKGVSTRSGQAHDTRPFFSRIRNFPPLGRTIRQKCQPGIVVDTFDEWFDPMGGNSRKKRDEWHAHVLSVFPLKGTKLCSPNEEVERPNEHSGTDFQSTFHRSVAQIEYSPLWKLLWKSVPECSFGLPT